MTINDAEAKLNMEKQVELGRDWWHWFLLVFSSVFILYHILYVSDFLILVVNVSVPGHVHLSIHLACILFLTFLLVRAGKVSNMDKPPVYDVVLAFFAVVAALYRGIFFNQIVMTVGEGMLIYSIVGWSLAILLLEACRRLVGMAFTIVIAIFLCYPLISDHFPGILYSPSRSFQQWGEFLLASGDSIFSFVLNISAKIVVVFLFFSQLLLHSGAGEFFIDLAQSAFGTVRGGPAKIAIVASGFFGMLSNSPSGNVAATGSFTIPLMKKMGYRPYYAGAVEAVASLGGLIMPPVMGALIFILCDFIQMSYIEACIHAFIPACLYYLALFVMVDQEAVRLGLSGLAKDTLPSFWKTMKQGFWYGIPVIVLLYLLAMLRYSPEKAVIWSIASLLILAMFRKRTRLGPVKLMSAAEQTVRALLTAAVAMASVGIIMASVTQTGIGIHISRQLINIAGGNLVILLGLTAIVSFIMGMGVGSIGCYIFLAVLIVPSLVQLGVSDFAAHLFVIYWALVSFITPPVAVLAFVTAGFTNASPYKIGWQATRLGLLIYVLPFAFVFKPALLVFGNPLEIAVVTVFIAIGTVGLAFGVGGFFLEKVNWLKRIFFIIGSMLLIFGQTYLTIGCGAIIIGVLVLWQWLIHRSAPHQT